MYNCLKCGKEVEEPVKFAEFELQHCDRITDEYLPHPICQRCLEDLQAQRPAAVKDLKPGMLFRSKGYPRQRYYVFLKYKSRRAFCWDVIPGVVRTVFLSKYDLLDNPDIEYIGRISLAEIILESAEEMIREGEGEEEPKELFEAFGESNKKGLEEVDYSKGV